MFNTITITEKRPQEPSIEICICISRRLTLNREKGSIETLIKKIESLISSICIPFISNLLLFKTDSKHQMSMNRINEFGRIFFEVQVNNFLELLRQTCMVTFERFQSISFSHSPSDPIHWYHWKFSKKNSSTENIFTRNWVHLANKAILKFFLEVKIQILPYLLSLNQKHMKISLIYLPNGENFDKFQH